MKFQLRPADASNPSYVSRYKDLQSPQIQGSLKFCYKNVLIEGEADYAWVLSGKADIFYQLNFNQVFYPANYTINRIRGDLFDTVGQIGYQIQLFDISHYQLWIIPRFGGSYHHQSVKHGPASPDLAVFPPPFPPNFNSVSQSIDLTVGRIRWDWYGPFLGGDIRVCFPKYFVFEAGYAYHWLDLKASQNLNRTIVVTSPFIVGDITLFNTNATSGKNRDVWGHTAKAKIIFLITQNWKIDFWGKFLYYKTKERRKYHSNSEITITPPIGPDTVESQITFFKTRWDTFQGGLNIVYCF